jgi:hypothetical protein
MIKIRKIWDIIPIPIIITDLLPKKFGGGTLICIVLLRPKHKDNEGLIQHELTHIKQNLRTCLFSALKQNWSKQHRLDRECEAYAVQLSYSNTLFHKDLYIDFMYNKYNLGMSKERIEKNFNKWIRRIG